MLLGFTEWNNLNITNKFFDRKASKKWTFIIVTDWHLAVF